MQILIINGPNLNLLGKREADIYGHQTFEAYLSQLRSSFPQVNIDYFQSNIEGEIVDKLHEVGFSDTMVILNAGAYTHSSVAIHDAIAAVNSPVMEVHISNIYARESFRHKNLISSKCVGVIAGLGLTSYLMAINYYIAQTPHNNK